jgi:hypothetical protein
MDNSIPAPNPPMGPYSFPAVFPVTADDRQRFLPRDLATSGTWPGNTDIMINGNAVIISGRNRTIQITNTDGVLINLGSLTSGFGFQVTDTSGLAFKISSSGGVLLLSVVDGTGFTLFTMDGQTWKWYDKINNKNIMQVGKLPDGTYGWAIAKVGNNVADAFS